MKIILLAAGRSKRMQPIRDKNFLDFLGKPLIQWQLEMLWKNGFKEIAVVGGKHNLEAIEILLKKLGKKVDLVEQKNLEMGMCGAVLAAKKFIGKDAVLVFSSNDVVEEKAFKVMMAAYKSGKADSFLLGKKVEKYFPGGYLKSDKKGFISEIVEKPEPGKEPGKLINLVVHIHGDSARLIKHLEKVKSVKDDLYEVGLTNMIKDGVKMMAVPYEGFWQPLKFPWHVQHVFKYLFSISAKTRAKSAKIAKNAIINGDVIIGEKAVIFDGAIINGPAYIGENTLVATNALVRESHVGKNCIIGFSTEIARSHLGHDVWTHTNYIGDSVIGNNVSFGSGTVTGNLRLDEGNIHVDCEGKKIDTQTNKFGLVCGDNVRIGINTSLMPGIKVGNNSFVGAGIVVPENIPDDSFVRGKWELKISKNKVSVEGMNRDEMRKRLK
ncbi:MAG: sugar phosphate nucleotidyltransferase [Candidatus Gracilibacteria bacterium]